MCSSSSHSYLQHLSLEAMPIVIPPSPALSLCDSLSSEDLDLYLDSLPPLDALPSPDMREAWWNDKHNVRVTRQDSFMSVGEPSYNDTYAKALCTISPCEYCDTIAALPAMIARFLENAQLPLETVAIAYNILSSPRVASLHCWHDGMSAPQGEHIRDKMLEIHGPEADASCQRALIILSSLSLAASFSEDRPRNTSYWSRQVGELAFSTEQINAMSRILLAQLDWQIHSLAAPIHVDAAISALSTIAVKANKTTSVTPSCLVNASMKLLIGPYTTIEHGLITPEASPDCFDMEDESGSQTNRCFLS